MLFSTRTAEIAALAAAVDARMDATETPAGAPEATTTTPSPTPGPTAVAVPTEPVTDPGKPAEGVDWQALARKHEDRAKANKAAAERAAEEKAAADQARSDAEQAKQQADAERQDFLKGLAKLLGHEQSETPPDPAALQREIAARDTQVTELTGKVGELEAKHATELRERDVEIAAWRAASKQGANVPALLDSRTFLQSLAKLDPGTETFAADLDEAVKAALTANISLRATPPVPPPNEAGIGATGARNAPGVTPGIGRLRAAYS